MTSLRNGADFLSLDVMQRRRFVSLIAGGAAAPAVLSRIARAQPLSDVGSLLKERPICTAVGVRAAYPCLEPGRRIDRWTVVELLDPKRGEIPLVLATASGERFRVDVLRRDEGAPGVANTAALSLYLCNQGKGRQATREEHGLGVMALARALEDGSPTPRLPLLTLRERNRRFPAGPSARIG
jgi:hypothetical protein